MVVVEKRRAKGVENEGENDGQSERARASGPETETEIDDKAMRMTTKGPFRPYPTIPRPSDKVSEFQVNLAAVKSSHRIVALDDR